MRQLYIKIYIQIAKQFNNVTINLAILCKNVIVKTIPISSASKFENAQ